MSYNVDVRKIRGDMQMSRAAFAKKFHLNAFTVRDWELGRYCPNGYAKVLLMIIERTPDAVLSVLDEMEAMTPHKAA